MKQHNFPLLMTALCSVLVFTQCKKNRVRMPADERANTIDTFSVHSPSVMTNLWKDNPYKLNVVYFVPSDMDTVKGYTKRLSRILLDGQQFFATNLKRQGYEDTSFGLDLINDSTINIILLRGEKDKSIYPYGGGESAVLSELNAYYLVHPDRKLSDHNLIIMPSTSGDSMKPGGVPFYGVGRNCFALDYEFQDAKYLGQKNDLGSLATKWIGGLMHELGHGLNAPHNYGTKSDAAKYGTALMGGGNFSYGKNPTYITNAIVGILANSQTFSKTTRDDWYKDFKFNITELSSTFKDGKITLKGKFTSSMDINDIAVFFDREPYGGNNDYDAISFAAKPVNKDSFEIECPLSEFQNTDKKYQLILSFVAQNGRSKSTSFVFPFVDDIPNLDNVFVAKLHDISAWQITASDFQSGDAPAKILDGDPATIWHSVWNPTAIKHSIDMKKSMTFNTLIMYNRSNLYGAMKDFRCFTSADGVNWTELGNYTLARVVGANYIPLGKSVVTRYLKIQSVNSWENVDLTHLAELDVYTR